MRWHYPTGLAPEKEKGKSKDKLLVDVSHYSLAMEIASANSDCFNDLITFLARIEEYGENFLRYGVWGITDAAVWTANNTQGVPLYACSSGFGGGSREGTSKADNGIPPSNKGKISFEGLKASLGGNITTNNIISDLIKITGMKLELDGNDNLVYTGYNSGEGSKTARDFLFSLLDNPDVNITVVDNHIATQEDKNMIGICSGQIDAFINGTPGTLNNMTMGYGMLFLHESQHTDWGNLGVQTHVGQSDRRDPFVAFENTIRSEMGKNCGVRLYYGCADLQGSHGFSYSSFRIGPEREANYININFLSKYCPRDGK